jgi:hypothetical protein
LSCSLEIGNSLGCWSASFSWPVELFWASILSARESYGSGQYHFHPSFVFYRLRRRRRLCSGFYGYHNCWLMQSKFDKNFVSFRRAVDSVFNNRDSRSGKLIKSHGVEDQRWTPGEEIYLNQKPLSLSLNASEIRQIEYCRTYRH